MPSSTSLLLFLGATLALNVMPGPDMLYVAARSGAEGRRAGLLSALGIATGCMVHVLAVALGLSRLFAANPAARAVVQYAGAAYLVYLGIGSLRSVGRDDGRALEPASPAAIFRQGVVTNVLNPKVALFFLAFLPQFVSPGAVSPGLQLLLLGLLFNVSGTLVNTGVAFASSGAGAWLRDAAGPSPWFRRAIGVMFMALGLRLALLRL